jgi:membrane protein required for colicin V production
MTLDLGWVDIGLLVFLAISVLVGLMRGFVFEVLSLAGWFVAYFAALQWNSWVLPHIPVGEPGSLARYGLAFAVVFLGVLIAWNVAARVLRGLIRATPLSPVDRLFGASFGLLRGAIALVFLAAVVSITPLVHSEQWQHSHGVLWLTDLLRGLRPWLSNDVFHYPSA